MFRKSICPALVADPAAVLAGRSERKSSRSLPAGEAVVSALIRDLSPGSGREAVVQGELTLLYSGAGLSTTALNGGRFSTIEKAKPWLAISSVVTCPSSNVLPEPPYWLASLCNSSR